MFRFVGATNVENLITGKLAPNFLHERRLLAISVFIKYLTEGPMDQTTVGSTLNSIGKMFICVKAVTHVLKMLNIIN